MVQAEAVHPPPAQRRRYLNCNQRILAIVDDYYPNWDNCTQLMILKSTLSTVFWLFNFLVCFIDIILTVVTLA